MVISISLHHQQSYNFHKIQQENAKWMLFKCGASLFLFPPGALCKTVYYTCLRARGPCPLLTWPTLKTIRGTFWDRTAGCLTTGCWAVRLQVWHPWLVLETSLILRHAITWGRFVFTFTVPNQFWNLVWGQEPMFLWSSTHDCWQTNIQSSQEVKQWNAIFSCIIAVLITDQSVYFRISNSDEIIIQWSFANGAYQFQYKLWEYHNLTVQPVITYIYLCGQIYASCLSYFWNHPYGIEQKLNWNLTQPLKTIYHFYFIMYRQLVLSPF
jgi:hypothetical protein